MALKSTCEIHKSKEMLVCNQSKLADHMLMLAATPYELTELSVSCEHGDAI